MNSLLLAALGGVGLLASCTTDQRTETAAAASGSAPNANPLITTDASPIPTVYPNAADTSTFRAEARQLAGRVATDLELRDPLAERRLEKVYFARRRRQAQLDDRYLADTAGRYAALRQLNDDTDRAVRQVLPSPALVSTYESSRAAYYDGPAAVDAAAEAVEAQAAEATRSAAAPAAKTRVRAGRRGPRIVKYKKSGGEVKIKYSNGMTLKIDEKGNRKTKYGLGAKAKAAFKGRRRKAKD